MQMYSDKPQSLWDCKKVVVEGGHKSDNAGGGNCCSLRWPLSLRIQKVVAMIMMAVLLVQVVAVVLVMPVVNVQLSVLILASHTTKQASQRQN